MNILKYVTNKLRRQPLTTSPIKFSMADWKDAFQATQTAISTKQLGILAAGIAYFAAFAFFPLIAASVAIASLVISQEQLTAVVTALNNFLPSDIADLVTTQFEAAFRDEASSFLIAVLGVLLALFSISGAVVNLMSATNAVYERTEGRGFVSLRLTSLGLMAVTAVGALLVFGLLLLNQPLLSSLGAPYWLAVLVTVVRWPLIVLLFAALLSVLYRYGPDRPSPQWQWVSWGSLIAATAWLIVTALFFVYARYFASFSESYSIFAGIIVLLTWFNLTAFIVLLGAEINFRLESRTARFTKG